MDLNLEPIMQFWTINPVLSTIQSNKSQIFELDAPKISFATDILPSMHKFHYFKGKLIGIKGKTYPETNFLNLEIFAD